MSDIVERLRQYGHNMNIVPFRICDEAADEIERLRALQPEGKVDDGPITQEEMIELFGETMPIEAVALMHEAPDGMTLSQMRAELRRMAYAKARKVAQDRADEIERLQAKLSKAVKALKRYAIGYCGEDTARAALKEIGGGND